MRLNYFLVVVEEIGLGGVDVFPRNRPFYGDPHHMHKTIVEPVYAQNNSRTEYIHCCDVLLVLFGANLGPRPSADRLGPRLAPERPVKSTSFQRTTDKNRLLLRIFR